MPSGLRRRHFPPAIFDLFFFGQRVMHPGKKADVCAQYTRNLAGCCLAGVPVLFGQFIGRRLQRKIFPINGKDQAGDGFVKQTVPRS